jgi:hypothetical protein
MKQNPRELLDAAAGTRIPADVNLYPRIAAQLERKTLMQTLRAKPALMILFVLLALALLSGAAYAIGRSLGYIPGVGIVEQGTPIRVLAEPVSVTRDGITITVTSATLAADKTVITYTIENVPWDALSHREDEPGCYGQANIRLPNGSLLVPLSGSGGMDASGRWETRMVYSAVPPQFNDGEFLLDCIRETLPGLAPENWKLTLHFIPAPPDLTVMPVVEIPLPTPAPSASGIPVQTGGLVLEKVIETEAGYILIGKFHADTLPGGAQALGFSQWPRVIDAAGQELPYRTANDVDVVSTTMGEFPWTLEIVGKAQAWPLTIQLEALDAQAFDLSAQFTFDAGQNPQAGQEWQLNQDVRLGDFTVRVNKIVFTGTGYYFEMTAPSEVRSVSLDILDTTPLGGSSGNNGQGLLTASADYDQPPNGLLTVSLSAPILTLRGGWSLQWQPENAPQIESLYGIRLVLDQFIPLDDGYYLIGHTEWTDERILHANVTLGARDASGGELALDPLYDQEITLPENGWAFKIYGKAFDGDVRLTARDVYIEYSQPALLTIDLRPYNFSFDDANLGVPYKTGLIPVDIPGLSAQLAKATYIKQGDLRGFELAFDADTRLSAISLVISDGLDTSGLDGVASGGSSSRDPQSGFIISQATTNARMFFPMTFRIYGATLRGNWSVTWTPPTPEVGATPFYIPQACLGLDSVKQALANPPAIPSGLEGRLLLMRGALAPDPTLFIANLDGSAEIPLAFGHGTLSPDGSRVAYSDENNQLTLMEVASKQKIVLGPGYLAPRWSPDGAKIAFQRETAKGFNIFIMDADGSNPRALTDTTEHFSLSGWSGDGQSLLIQTGTRIEFLNVNDGSRSLLLETRSNSYGSPSAALSPDGKWLAYLDKVVGRMTPGLYLKALPDGEPRLLVQLEHWSVFNPVFSPDGQWLAFSVLNGDTGMDSRFMLLNTANCQAIPLNELQDEIRQWVAP